MNKPVQNLSMTLLVAGAICSNCLTTIAQEAAIGNAKYATLAEAFAAAEAGQTITLSKDIEVTSMLPVTKSVKLDLNGKTISNMVKENRLFRLSGIEFTIEGNGGSIIIPESNNKSYGFVDFRDTAGAASESTRLVAANVYFKGSTDEGSLFAFRNSGQALSFDNVNVELTASNTYSIINGYRQKVDINLNGGTYICNSTNQTAGVFQCGTGSTIDFNGVKVTTSVGPVFDIVGSTATFTNCDMTNTATNSYFASCIAPSNGSVVTVNGGTYTADYPLYIFNSGGTLNVNGGSFNGNIAAVKADNAENAEHASTVQITNGTFNGPISADTKSTISISGGSYSEEPAERYLADGFIFKKNEDGTYGVQGIESGIDKIEAPSNGTKGIYDIHGVKIDSNIESLPAGLYIIDGKKIFVR